MTLLDINGRPKYDLAYLNEKYSEVDFNQLVFKKPDYDWDPVFRTNLKDYNGRLEYLDRVLTSENFRTLAHLLA